MNKWLDVSKRIAGWLLPHEVHNLVRRTSINRQFRTTPTEKNLLKINRQFRNLHRDRRCFILATGPSLKTQDLRLLKDDLCIAVSNFFVHPDFSYINPAYYCVAPYHLPITEIAWHKWLHQLDSSTSDTTFFFDLADYERNLSEGLFSSRDKGWLQMKGNWESVYEGIELTRAVPRPQSVSVMALMIAIYMGCPEIYLLGCDHDWILHLHESTHFYEERDHVLKSEGYNEWFNADFKVEFNSNMRLWSQYERLSQLARSRSINIYNATNGGLLDVFPRVDYNSLFDGLPY